MRERHTVILKSEYVHVRACTSEYVHSAIFGVCTRTTESSGRERERVGYAYAVIWEK